MKLSEAGSWDVYGGHDREDWFYRTDVFGASKHRSYRLPAASVLHFTYSTDSLRPWQGISPVNWAKSTARLVSNIESRAADEGKWRSWHVDSDATRSRR